MAKIYDDMGFYDLDEYIDESYLDWVNTDPSDILSYPISFLNDALGGITKSELVVLGADSGQGKSEIANELSFQNAEKGKRVYLFSLEGDKYDVINRQRYKEYVWRTKLCERWDMYVSYRDFLQNKAPKTMASEILDLDEEFKRKYKTLKIYNREDSLNIDLFESHLEMINDRADIVIIDHLHYFEFQSANEYSELTEIMKRVKRLQDKHRVPIILVSHLRKKDKTRTFPDQNDFHGSSNIVKQADTCIVFSHIEPNQEEDNAEYEKQVESNLYKTGIRIAKSRTGFSSRLIAIVNYDTINRKYEDQYKLAICGNNYITMMDEANYPRWSKNAKTKFYERDGTVESFT